jgi:phosphatidylserine/phosphatidylglycerophosphate/cardiolipin synthase-like enzyme
VEFTPTVNQAAEFLEISNDFTNPKEVVREAISNCFDAGAKNIRIEIYIDKSIGIDEIVLLLKSVA